MIRFKKAMFSTVAGRPLLVIAVSMPVFGTSGCAQFGDSLRARNECCPEGQATCLPQESSTVPPTASINSTHRCVDPIPHDAVPAPLGTYVNQWRDAMSAGAQEQYWIISRNEWFDGGSQLGPHGKKHVSQVAQCIAREPRLVIIENEPVAIKLGDSYEESTQANAELQLTRRQTIVKAMYEAGVSDADRWVVFADDRAVGVRGIEAPDIFSNRQFLNVGGNRGGISRGQGGLGVGQGVGGIGGGGGFGGGGIF